MHQNYLKSLCVAFLAHIFLYSCHFLKHFKDYTLFCRDFIWHADRVETHTILTEYLAMALVTQHASALKIFTTLADDTLILEHLYGTEQASTPYVFHLELQSTQTDIDLDQLIGTDAQVQFTYGPSERYFCGRIGRIEQGRTYPQGQDMITQYRAQIYPTLWFLKFTQDCRIFQNQSAMQIILQVLQEQGVQRIQDHTQTGGRTTREYCVQYRESAFNFASRLMEEEGIFYYFTHDASGETLVLCDDSYTLSQTLTLPIPIGMPVADTPAFHHIQSLTASRQVVAQAFAAADYNFETAGARLYNRIEGKGHGGRVYRYPGGYQDLSVGDRVTQHRIQELEWFKQKVHGESTVPLCMPMSPMTITDHPNTELNQTYIPYKVYHEVSMHPHAQETRVYTNEFTAFPSDIPFRPPIVSAKPIIPSTQTAIVSGKAGEEIWCDAYGRIKVKFHWDQSHTQHEDTSCWIRVAQMWAGNQWGSLWTPRVGMEVVVTFLEGDPDRPLITGCVYNSLNMPPYAQEEPTKSTIRSNSTKDGDGGFNEFRFEDLKGSEEIYIHAQKDHNTVVEDHRTLRINDGDDTSDIMAGDRCVTLHGEKRTARPQRGDDTLVLTKGSRKVQLQAAGENNGDHLLELTRGNSTLHILKGDQVITLDQGNRIFTLSQGNDTVEIHGTRTTTIHDDETRTNEGGYTQNVAQDHTLEVHGKLTIKVTGAIDIEGLSDVSIKSQGNLELAAMQDIKINSMANTKIDAAANLDASGLMVQLAGKVSTTVDGGPTLTLRSTGNALLTSSGAASVKAGGLASLGGSRISLG